MPVALAYASKSMCSASSVREMVVGVASEVKRKPRNRYATIPAPAPRRRFRNQSSGQIGKNCGNKGQRVHVSAHHAASCEDATSGFAILPRNPGG